MRRHYAAVKAQIEAAPILAGKVHDAVLLNADGSLVRTSYVVMHGGGPDVLDDARFTASQSVDSSAEYVYQVRCVGSTQDAALAVATAVMAQLVGFVPAIPGRSCRKMRLDDASKVEVDDSVKPPMFYLDLDFVLNSDRA